MKSLILCLLLLGSSRAFSQSVDLGPTFSTGGGGGSGVSSLNSLTGALNILPGSGITVTPSGSNITIAATGGGGGVSAVTASSPLVSSGGSTPNLTCNVASGSIAGCLSSADWTTFNSKQAAGSYITSLTGDVTGSGPGATATSLVATSNSTLTTLSALALPAAQVTNGDANTVALFNSSGVLSDDTLFTYVQSTHVLGLDNDVFYLPTQSSNYGPIFGWFSNSDLYNTPNSPFVLGSTDTAVDSNTTDIFMTTGSNTAVGAVSNTGSLGFIVGAITDSTATAQTGQVQFQTGANAGSGNTGTINLGTGANSGTGDTGGVQISSGAITGASVENTGAVVLQTGNTSGSGNSGNIQLTSGSVSGGTRGNIQFQNGTEGTAGYIWTSTDIYGSGAWVNNPGGGANTALSNLVGVAINAPLQAGPGLDLQVSTGITPTSANGNSLYLDASDGDATAPGYDGGNINMQAGGTYAAADPGGSINITGGSGYATGPGGNIVLVSGSSVSSTRGLIQFQNGTEGTSGQCWTSIDTSGTGAWQACGGGGGGGANTALSNLASVAVNTDILPDTGITHNLGGAAFAWNQTYSQSYYGPDGGTVTFSSYPADTSSAGNNTYLVASNGDATAPGYDGGSVNITAGATYNGDPGGPVDITGGSNLATGQGGNVVLTGGYSSASGPGGGSVNLVAGQDSSLVSGNIGLTGSNFEFFGESLTSRLIFSDTHLKSIRTNWSAPTVTVSSNAGTGASGSASDQTDIAGNISLTTTNVSSSSGNQIQLNFSQSYDVPPIVMLTPTNAAAALNAVVLGVYVTTTNSAAVINFANADLVGGTYTWSYQVISTY